MIPGGHKPTRKNISRCSCKRYERGRSIALKKLLYTIVLGHFKIMFFRVTYHFCLWHKSNNRWWQHKGRLACVSSFYAQLSTYVHLFDSCTLKLALPCLRMLSFPVIAAAPQTRRDPFLCPFNRCNHPITFLKSTLILWVHTTNYFVNVCSHVEPRFGN